MKRRRYAVDLVESCCPHCGERLPAGIPAAKLLDQLPGESGAEYALRMRREWKRETSRGRRAPRLHDATQLEQDVYDVLGVR